MSDWIAVVIASVVFVALFVLGMSLTLIFKGHHIDSEIATNENMRRLGIKCVVEEAREQYGAPCDEGPCSGNCGSCAGGEKGMEAGNG